MNKTALMFVAIAVFTAALIGALIWRSGSRVPQAPPQTQDSGTVEPAPAASAPELAASEPAIKHPLEAEASAPLAASEIDDAIGELVGGKALRSFFQVDNFAHRFVSTVDNLGRAHAPPRLWPINPTEGKFSVDKRGGRETIASANSQRYAPLIVLAETVDVEQAVDLYVRMYPHLQKAYEDLGFPKRYFNDRLIEVIDQLLAAPQSDQPLEVDLIEVKGPVQPVRPWVRYEYADERLESLSAGQRIMLRVGPENERRIKARLQQIRDELAERSAAQ